jgi:hypothetical protein
MEPPLPLPLLLPLLPLLMCRLLLVARTQVRPC